MTAAEAPRHQTEGRKLLLCEPTDRALVLGSSQPEPSEDLIDAPVLRRRTGGGAVWIEPGAQTWLEVMIPAEDVLWDDDLSRSFDWLGRVIADALRMLGHEPVVHGGAARPGRWGTTVCFAGLGPGEISVADRKVAGMSQRRNRAGARFSVALLHRVDLAPYGRAFGLSTEALWSIGAAVGAVDADGLDEAVRAAVTTV